MDKIYFLSYCLTNTLMYALIRLVHLQIHDYSTLEIAAYANILSIICFMPYILYRFRDIIKNFKTQYGLSVNSLASAMKVYVVQYISPKNAMVISFTQPIFIIILSALMLEKTTKFQYKKYYYVIFSFIGMLIFVGSDAQRYTVVYLIMFAHVILKALTNIYIKKITKDRYITLCYSLIFYALFGMLVLHARFVPEMLIDPRIIIVAIISTVSQLVLIRGYEIASKISLLQNIDYSRIVFSFFWTWLFFNEPVLMNQIAGTCIILFSVYFSQARDIKDAVISLKNTVKARRNKAK